MNNPQLDELAAWEKRYQRDLGQYPIYKDFRSWHLWFAWYPVVPYGTLGEKVWFRTVERQVTRYWIRLAGAFDDQGTRQSATFKEYRLPVDD